MLLFVWRPICREFEDRLIGVFTETRGDFCSQGPTHNAASHRQVQSAPRILGRDMENDEGDPLIP